MNILAVGAHPDDLVLQCGGTLAKYAAAGHQVVMAIMCPGVTKYSTGSRELLVAKRRQEVEASAAVIGAAVIWLEYREFALPYDLESKLPLVEAMRKANPDVLITHHPDDYSIDHRRTSELVDECYMMAFQPGIKTESPPVEPVAVLYYMDTMGGMGFLPDFYVDITDYFETKMKMIRCHESEVKPYEGHPVVDTLDWVEVNARYRGIQASVRYAEAFAWPRRWACGEAGRLLP